MTEASSPKPAPPPGVPPSKSSPRAAVSWARVLSDDQKEALTIQALGLLSQQVRARYQTPKIPPQSGSFEEQRAPEELEEQQTHLLSQLLQQFFAEQAQAAVSIWAPLRDRLARLFFESELQEGVETPREKPIQHPEQGLYYVLSRYRHRLRAELDAFEYQTPELRAATIALLADYERDLKLASLSRRSPELSQLLGTYGAVLGELLRSHLPARLEQMSKVTIRVCKSARRPSSLGHRLRADSFEDFRAEWERQFMQQLVFFCGDALLGRLASANIAEESAVKLFTDPRLFSETCAVVCEKLYDFLSLEGFLGLPAERLAAGSELP